MEKIVSNIKDNFENHAKKIALNVLPLNGECNIGFDGDFQYCDKINALSSNDGMKISRGSFEERAAELEKETIDLIVSNMMINRIANLEGYMTKIFEALKDGGEYFITDLFCDRRIPENVAKSSSLKDSILEKVIYEKDFLRVARKVGFAHPRELLTTNLQIDLDEQGIYFKEAKYCIATYRLFKIEGLEDACEDYGQTATYKGGLEKMPVSYVLDGGHTFLINKPERVCANTAFMVCKTRVKEYFEIKGSLERHIGEFKNCGTTNEIDDNDCGCFSK